MRHRGMKHPFKARDATHEIVVNSEVSEVLHGVENMLYLLARSQSRGRLKDHEISEMVQECREWLWKRSLPKYDSHRRVKVQTFIYQCARNFFRQHLRASSRSRKSTRRKKIFLVNPEHMLHSLRARSEAIDDRVAVVAEDVMEHPDKFFTEAQIKVFQVLLQNPNVPKQDLAAMLGYKRASSLSMMVRRIKERIREIDIEDHEPEVE
jgi:DNA-directed RNA polymerase specialized sigma24 family protein